MKKLLFIVLFVSTISHAFAQKKIGLGIHINQTQQTVAFGIDVTSPIILRSFHLRLAANQNLFEGAQAVGEKTRIFGFQEMRLGILWRSAFIKDKLNMYSEAGALVLFNNPKMTDSKTNFGGYGLFGIEVALVRHTWMYFEMGGIGTGASAGKLLNNPGFGNGLIFGAGARFYF